MKTTVEQTLQKTQIMVVDGSMSTALEQLGCNFADSLWTARALAESPELVKQVHLDYFRAGADSGITCSYQATIPGLMANGFTRAEAEELIVRSVELFVQARDEWWNAEGRAAGRAYPLCLAGIGPYGAYLADGSEYRGTYRVSDDTLRDFHRRRAQLLWDAGADILLFETQPALNEALIEAQIAEEMNADYWISFSCRDGAHINEGKKIRDCAGELSRGYPHLKMIGVNCTPPRFVESLIGEIKAGCGLPVAVYPNSGETYDAVTKTWHGEIEGVSYGDLALLWMQAGASAVGGCCRTVAKHIAEVDEARKKYLSE